VFARLVYNKLYILFMLKEKNIYLKGKEVIITVWKSVKRERELIFSFKKFF